jgi:hypothetical protein
MALTLILGMALLAWPLACTPPSAPAWPVLQGTEPPQDSPQSQPSAEPANPPAEEGKPDQTPSQQPAAPEAAKPSENSPRETEISKPREKAKASAAKTRKRTKKRKTETQAGPEATKVVVRDGGTTEPKMQLSPGLSQEQASRKLQNTNQLLATTEGNLKRIGSRELDASEQDMVKQIRKYVEQAKAAVGAGDLQRARNLAFKATQLSDELVKR